MKVKILRTNRKVKLSPHMTACKEQDGLLGNIEMNHYTNVGDMLHDSPFRVDPGSNLKRRAETGYKHYLPMTVPSHVLEWQGIADGLDKPGVFDKLLNHFKKPR